MICSVDIGLTGGLYNGTGHCIMPTKTLETKPAVMILAKDSNGKKQLYKSGPLEGTPKYKIKTPAKTMKVLDVFAIQKFFKGASTIVLEAQGTSMGNSSRSSRTTAMNYGKLLAIAELTGAEVVTVPPHVWKKALGLSQDKMDSILLAEKLTGESFRTPRGRLLDGQGEALLIHHWYTTKDK